MPAARYWRLSGITTRGGQTLDLSQLELWAGGAKLTATLTCPVTPLSGTLANLSDADLGTAASWTLCPGLVFNFDLGSSLSVDAPKFGSVGLAGFPESVMLEYSADSITWATFRTFNRVIYPGASALTSLTYVGVIPATWDTANKGANCALTNANLTATGRQTAGTARSSVSVASGKYYWEITSTGARYPLMGVGNASATLAGFIGSDVHGWGWHGAVPQKYHAGSASAFGSAWNDNTHVVGLALDADAGTLEVFKNGTSMGVMYTGMTGPYYAMTGGDTDSYTSNTTANFGATSFAHTVPSGYTAGFGEMGGAIITEPAVITQSLIGVLATTNILPPDFATTDIGPQIMPGLGVGGTSRITGTVKVTPATPVARKVRLYRECDGHLMAEVWSNASTGAYSFDNIPPDFAYTVISYDHTQTFRAVVADRVLSEPM